VEEAALEIGLRIPEDLSILCFDLPCDRKSESFYTHVVQNEAEIGKKAFSMICDVLEGNLNPTRTIIETELRTRKSTAINRKNDSPPAQTKIVGG